MSPKLDQEGAVVRFTTEPNRFKAKPGSIFPKKRRLVKSMILDSIFQFLCSFSASGAQKDKDDCSNKMAPFPKSRHE
ncbi:hypothetical protein PanWU01x14_216800 [Parasponia andersonii]|uniref:Uncharacterized protein n=1 Tax=Parasponia andersonii TaxID=3476 RepID=A0A2P5BRL9_PARAD|nr:hypothetical protein PanWU01x14_216800 [Parasponia andersonii]